MHRNHLDGNVTLPTMRNDIQQHHALSGMAPPLLCQPAQNTDQIIDNVVKSIRRIIIFEYG